MEQIKVTKDTFRDLDIQLRVNVEPISQSYAICDECGEKIIDNFHQ